MNFDDISNTDLEELKQCSKRVLNPNARWIEKPGHKQRNLKVSSSEYSFEIYQRQNSNDATDFSCGLRIIKPNGDSLTLCRYNGSSHVHGDIEYKCHIHTTTVQNITDGRKPERDAKQTDRYETLSGATNCLMLDCSVSGFNDHRPDEPTLFN